MRPGSSWWISRVFSLADDGITRRAFALQGSSAFSFGRSWLRAGRGWASDGQQLAETAARPPRADRAPGI
jgi:hypothetical protein